MLIAIIGENCSGKSTLAAEIQKEISGEIITGKDYLRMAKSEKKAENLFKEKLQRAVTGDHLFYVISEMEQLNFLPDETVKILVKENLSTILKRFSQRMKGNLPAPVEEMLRKKHGMFDNISYDYLYEGEKSETANLIKMLKDREYGRWNNKSMRKTDTPFSHALLFNSHRKNFDQEDFYPAK